MHLLLPPSEAKTGGGRGRAVGSRPGTGPLTESRLAAIAALQQLVAGPRDAAAAALLLPAGVADAAIAADAAVLDSPTTPALRRYAGVVYDGLDFAAMPPEQQRIAGRSVRVFSGLFGVVRGDEPVPDYRVPAKAVLPGLGVAGTFWRPVLDRIVPELLHRGPVVDLRSGDYAAMWRPRGKDAERVLTVRVLSPLPRGGDGVISYNSKFGKGRLAAALIAREAAGHRVTGAEDVAVAWADCGGRDCIVRPDGGLDLLTT